MYVISSRSRKKGDKWTIQLIKDNLKKQLIHLGMISYETKGRVLPMLFDEISIENFIFSLVYAKIGIYNKTISSFNTWITTYIEQISVEEIEMTNTLIDLQISLINNEKNLNK